jgi:hypothetical protein
VRQRGDLIITDNQNLFNWEFQKLLNHLGHQRGGQGSQ